MWEEKFFLKDKSQKEVEQELHKRGYNFGDTLRKALIRADFLLIQGKKGERRFIQKYPFVEEDKNDKRRKNK